MKVNGLSPGGVSVVHLVWLYGVFLKLPAVQVMVFD